MKRNLEFSPDLSIAAPRLPVSPDSLWSIQGASSGSRAGLKTTGKNKQTNKNQFKGLSSSKRAIYSPNQSRFPPKNVVFPAPPRPKKKREGNAAGWIPR